MEGAARHHAFFKTQASPRRRAHSIRLRPLVAMNPRFSSVALSCDPTSSSFSSCFCWHPPPSPSATSSFTCVLKPRGGAQEPEGHVGEGGVQLRPGWGCAACS
eukprot:9302400-Pyramimonas_sp.AAC.1